MHLRHTTECVLQRVLCFPVFSSRKTSSDIYFSVFSIPVFPELSIASFQEKCSDAAVAEHRPAWRSPESMVSALHYQETGTRSAASGQAAIHGHLRSRTTQKCLVSLGSQGILRCFSTEFANHRPIQDWMPVYMRPSPPDCKELWKNSLRK